MEKIGIPEGNSVDSFEGMTDESYISDEDWEKLLSFHCSFDTGLILKKLKDNNNQPTLATELTALPIHINTANRDFEAAGLNYRIRSIDPERNRKYSQHFRLVTSE